MFIQFAPSADIVAAAITHYSPHDCGDLVDEDSIAFIHEVFRAKRDNNHVTTTIKAAISQRAMATRYNSDGICATSKAAATTLARKTADTKNTAILAVKWIFKSVGRYSAMLGFRRVVGHALPVPPSGDG
jgi:hypothetical protein